MRAVYDTGLRRCDGRHGVGVIGRGHHHRVDLFVHIGEHAAEIPVGLGFLMPPAIMGSKKTVISG